MKNKKTRYMTILTAAIALSLTSCVKDELFNTPHPDLGAVIVTTDWSAKSAEAEIPQNYTLRMERRSRPRAALSTRSRRCCHKAVTN